MKMLESNELLSASLIFTTHMVDRVGGIAFLSHSLSLSPLRLHIKEKCLQTFYRMCSKFSVSKLFVNVYLYFLSGASQVP